jgi:hypothetical protein
MKYINSFCGQNAEFYVEVRGTYNSHRPLKVLACIEAGELVVEQMELPKWIIDIKISDYYMHTYRIFLSWSSCDSLLWS